MTYPQQTANPAQTADQRRIGAALAQLGWTRRRYADAAGVNMYAVWRAQHGLIRLNEVATWDRFLSNVTADPTARVQRALAVLDRADRARSVTTLRELTREARAILKEEN